MSTGPASRSDSLPRFGRGAALGLSLAFLLLGVAFTAPLVLHLHDSLPYAAVPLPGRELVHGAPGDYLQFYYYLWLVRERVLAGASFLRDPYQFAIDGPRPNLPNIFLPAALLFVPLSALGPRFAYNALVLLSFPFAGLAAALLARRYGVSRAGAAVAGTVFACMPYRVGALLGGHPAGLAYPLVPARAVGARGRARGVALGRPRGGRRSPRAGHDGAPLRLFRGAGPAALRAGARRASRLAAGAPGHRTRGLAPRGRRRPGARLWGARGPRPPGLAGAPARAPRGRRGGRPDRPRGLADARDLAPRGRRRGRPAGGRAPEPPGVRALGSHGGGRDRTGRTARRRGPGPSAGPARARGSSLRWRRWWHPRLPVLPVALAAAGALAGAGFLLLLQRLLLRRSVSGAGRSLFEVLLFSPTLDDLFTRVNRRPAGSCTPASWRSGWPW